MLVNLKGHGVKWNTLHSVLHHQAMIWTVWSPVQSITSVTLSGTHTDGTVRHVGLNFPPNGKYYVWEWVQSTKMNEKLHSLLLQSHQAGLPWWKMKMAESCSHSYTCLLLDRCASVCFFWLLVAIKHKLIWSQSSWGISFVFGLWGHNDEGG